VTATRIRLLLADVDGTLVTRDKFLTDRAIEAVRHLHDAAIRFAITSGARRMAWPCSSARSGCGPHRRVQRRPDRPDMKIPEQRVIPQGLVIPIAELLGSYVHDARGQQLLRRPHAGPGPPLSGRLGRGAGGHPGGRPSAPARGVCRMRQRLS
jgi:hypothetical protein